MILQRPGTLTIISEYVDDRTEAIHVDEKPFVIEVSDYVLDREFTSALLRGLGYRAVERRYDCATTVMARPPFLAALMRVDRQAFVGAWSVLRWMHRHGLVSTNAPEGYEVRWRDLRPFKMGKR